MDVEQRRISLHLFRVLGDRNRGLIHLPQPADDTAIAAVSPSKASRETASEGAGGYVRAAGRPG
jgi:hypothetical protein